MAEGGAVLNMLSNMINYRTYQLAKTNLVFFPLTFPLFFHYFQFSYFQPIIKYVLRARIGQVFSGAYGGADQALGVVCL